MRIYRVFIIIIIIIIIIISPVLSIMWTGGDHPQEELAKFG